MSKAWYTLIVQSNHEMKAKEEIEMKLLNGDESVDIEEVFVPIKKVVSMKDGKKKVIEERTYRGYIFVHADMTDDLYVKLKNCVKIQRIIGTSGFATKIPLRDIKKMKDDIALSQDSPSQLSEYTINDLIRINSGPFEGFEGTVLGIIEKKSELKVEITVFGKNTPVNIGEKHVEKIV
jgi:transcriptional antiterminator NusG